MKLRILTQLATALALVLSAVTAQAPHIVVFLSDDHTCRDSSVYGSTEVATENMARLAAAGTTFDRAFVASPSCAPSRAALLTGLYPANNGAEANHSRPRRELKKLPAYLQELGYQVVSFGKVGHYAQTPEYGFDLARHFGYHEDVAVPKAIEWLEARDDPRPLCLFVGTNWPHVPWPNDTDGIDPDSVQVPPHHVDNPTTRQWRARYLAAVRQMDRELGMVLDAAKARLGDDVCFVHTSDHGAQWPFGKWNLYEDGIRTPLIVSWPGRVAAGARTPAMVSWIDVLPTLVEIAGGTAPDGIDGRSFLPVLEGRTTRHRDVVMTAHSGDGNFNVFPIRAARDADGFQYVRNLHPGFRFESHVTANTGDSGYWSSWVRSAVESQAARRVVRRYQERPAEELYDLAHDPWEQHDLAADPAHAERLAKLRGEVDAWMEATGDRGTVHGEPVQKAPPTAPNVVVVLVDDMGWSDLSVCGGDAVETENIDRLAREGMRFTQFYVNSPICSPSRVALTTGQYPQRWRIGSYLDNRARNRERGVAQWLDPQAPVLPRELRRAGYTTGHFGKWHMGGQRDVADAPAIAAYGFDRSLTNFEGMGPKLLPLTETPESEQPGRIWADAERLGGPATWMQRSRITGGFVDAALTFVDEAVAKGQPFYVNVWPDDVHSPFFPPLDRWGDGKRARYYGVLDAMDEQLGRLLDRIREDAALRDNTLVILCSDNGPEAGAGTSRPLRGSKTWLYEGGLRSPLIVWGPGLLADGAAGTVDEQSVFSAIDLNRSLYALTGTTPPEGDALDGEDVLDALLGRAPKSRSAPLCFRRPPDRPGNDRDDNPDLAVRDGRFKLTTDYDGSNTQLFDLVDDPTESRDIAAERPDLVAQLRSTLLAWNAGLPADAGDPQFRQQPGAGPAPLAADRFVNPIAEGADPWVIRDPTAERCRYLWCFSEGNRAIAIHTSDRLTSLGEKHVVWAAPDTGPYSRQIWAPELHFLDGRFHIYFAASDGRNENHLAYVAVSEGADPLGSYTVHGPLQTGDRDGEPIWAIDMTVLELARDGEVARYALWSGWDAPGTDRQFLYAARMRSPTELETPRVRICANDDFPWEFTEERRRGRGLNEGPQVLQTERRTYVLFSCGASWLPTYKLGRLELTGRDPLDPLAWRKHDRPVFRSTDRTFGVGHSCFVRSPDGSELWHVFHAKRDREPGWRRGVFVQPMQIGGQGVPRFGRPVAPGEALQRPAGEPPLEPAKLPLQQPLKVGSDTSGWSGYAHHQMLAFEADGLHLGRTPAHPVNEYRCGEKVLLERALPGAFVAGVEIDFPDGGSSRDAGLLLRTTGPSVGYDAQRGYFAGLIPRTGLVVFGRMDGENWTELARAKVDLDTSRPHRLQVAAHGAHFAVRLDGTEALTVEDDSYPDGQLGLRVVDTHAVFRDLRIAAR